LKRKKDYYYKLAKKSGYKSRAAFKLIQIDQRFYIIHEGNTVLDLGASPGGWSQVARELVGDKGRVIAVDIKPVRVPGVEFVRGDVFLKETIEKIAERVEKVDVIISDMSPKISGVKSWDHARSIELAERAMEIAHIFLKIRGHMVIKVFQGDMLKNLVKKLKGEFELVKVHKPHASKSSSSEVYIVCKRYVGANLNSMGDRDHHGPRDEENT